jgi:hypothetical protein
VGIKVEKEAALAILCTRAAEKFKNRYLGR